MSIRSKISFLLSPTIMFFQDIKSQREDKKLKKENEKWLQRNTFTIGEHTIVGHDYVAIKRAFTETYMKQNRGTTDVGWVNAKMHDKIEPDIARLIKELRLKTKLEIESDLIDEWRKENNIKPIEEEMHDIRSELTRVEKKVVETKSLLDKTKHGQLHELESRIQKTRSRLDELEQKRVPPILNSFKGGVTQKTSKLPSMDLEKVVEEAQNKTLVNNKKSVRPH